MLIVSFAWTTPAVRARRKTRTRRSWSPSYAEKFRENSICQAYDKGPRVGGVWIDYIRLVRAPWIQNTRELNQDDYELEGFAYMDEWGFLCPPEGILGRDFLERWKAAAEDVYVVDFEYVDDLTYKKGCAYANCRGKTERCDLPRLPRVLGQMCAVCKMNCIRVDRR